MCVGVAGSSALAERVRQAARANPPTEDDEQAMVRAAEKGADCARVAVEMANLLFAIDDQLSADDE